MNNRVYFYGKRKENCRNNTLTREQVKAIKQSLLPYREDNMKASSYK